MDIKKVQTEVDEFWLNQKDREIEYMDFKKLPFMTRCIMETLRLRNALPSGTFREFKMYVIEEFSKIMHLLFGLFFTIFKKLSIKFIWDYNPPSISKTFPLK